MPSPRALPATPLPAGHRRIVFTWDYREKVFGAHGQGVARIAPPDSVRLDFFLENGSSGGFVLMLGDSLYAPAREDARRYIPSIPLLWATLGRLAPSAIDTSVALDGDTLRADIGRAPTWRATFAGDRLVRLEHIREGRILEFVVRPDSAHVLYRHAKPGRTLRLTIIRQLEESAFDEAIWRR